MKKLLQKSVMIVFLFLFCLGINQKIFSQVAGDFRSTTSGNWGTSTTWQRYNGTAWESSGTGANNPGQVPSSTSSVWIQTAHTVTLTANGSCKDLHIASSTTVTPSATTLGKIALATFTLSVNGKIRNYYGALNTIPGTSQANGYSIYPFTGTTGKVSIVGSTRNVTLTGEWGATITTPATGVFPLEINMADNTQVATFQTNTKSTSLNVAVGIASGTTFSMDNGTTGQGDATIATGATLISAATSNNAFQRTGSTRAGTLTINGTLKFSAGTPTFAMNAVTNNGTVEYSNAGNQTFVTATNSGVNMSYKDLVISGSGVKTLALATTVTGTTTVNTSCTLATGAFTLTNSGTANINGSFRLDQGGWGGSTGTYNYGTTGTLVFNNTTGTYNVNSADTWWPTTNGPVNITVQGGGGIIMNVARTVPSSGTSGTFLLVTGTNAIQGTALTLNGNVQINGGNFQTTPTYGASSTLIYNTTYGTFNEWTGGASGSVSAGSGVPANVQVLTGTLTLAGGRGVPGNVTVTAGGLTLNATSGDLYIGGNLTNNGTWTNNSRAVRFVGTGTSVVTASSGTQFFDYLLIEKTSGSVQIASATNVTINTTSGSVLQLLNAGTLDLNGRTLTLNNSGGNILVDGTSGGTTKSIVSTSGTGTIAITNNKTASGNASGTLSTSSSVNWILTGGMNFGGVTTVNGTLQLNSGGFVTTNAPTYGTGSLLKYNSGANPFNRTTEWSASSGNGYPYNVQLSNNTTMSPGGSSNTGTALNVANNLTIDSGSSIHMDYGGNNMTVPLIVNNDLNLNGNLSGSGASGGDIVVKGNWNRTGSLLPNGRAVFLQGANAQTITGATTFDYLLIDKTAGSVTLANDVTVNTGLTFTATNPTVITTGSNKVIVGASGSVTKSGAGYVNGNLQKSIPTGTNSRTFEIGDSSNYTPVTLDYSGVTGAGNVVASTTAGDHAQIGTSDIDASYSVNRTYTLTNSGVTGGSYDATFNFVAGDVDSGALTNAFGVSSYAASTWTSATVSTRTSTSTKATGLTGYGDFQLGETATVWTAGASTTDWATSGNWSKGVPSVNINAVIPSASMYPEISATAAANRMSVASGASVTVKSGYNLTVTDAIANSGTITVENNANLKQTNNVSNSGSGTAVVKRDTATLMRQDYVMWSSPVDGQQLQAFSPQTLSTRFYTFDGSAGTAGQYVATSATGNFATATGYLIRLPNNHPTTPTIWNGTFTGTGIHNGNYSLTGLNSSQYYAVGNPYPSTIDADLFIAGNSLADAMYFWRKTNNSANPSYATYTLAGGVGTPGSGDPLGLTPNGVINVGQGFIVKTSGSATSLNFTNGMRTTNNGNLFFRTNDIERNRIWLNMSNASGIACQTMVSYMENATTGFDSMIDGKFLNDSQNALTSIINGEEYAIQGRALPFESTDNVALGFKSELPGEFSIAIDHVDGFFINEHDIFLKDNLTNTVHDLRTGPYTFTTIGGIDNTRFELVYENLLSVNPHEFAANQVIAYTRNNQLNIDSGAVKMAQVEVYDIRGRLIVQEASINASKATLNIPSTHQVLLVKITAENGQSVTKKVMN